MGSSFFKRVFTLLLTVTIAISAAAGEKKKVTVVGRFLIKSSKPIRNKKVRIHFNERLWGKYTDMTDDSGYFVIRLPEGDNFISLVEYFKGDSFFKNLPEKYAHVEVSADQPVVYIGDVVLEWNITGQDSRSSGGAIGVMREAKQSGSELPIAVSSNPESLKHFQELYKGEIPTLLLKVEQ